jgi:hypothetical protein
VIKINIKYMELWVCGKHIKETEDGNVWDIQGIFNNKDLALKACKNESYFIAPIIMNEYSPDETTDWPGVEFPINRG